MLLSKRISSHTFPILVSSRAIQGDNPKTKSFSISVAVGPSKKIVAVAVSNCQVLYKKVSVKIVVHNSI